MSHVRMCDSCANVFSENAKNWSTGQMTVMRENTQTGRNEPVTLTQDKCPDCTMLMSTPSPYGKPEVQPTYNRAIPVGIDEDDSPESPHDSPH